MTELPRPPFDRSKLRPAFTEARVASVWQRIAAARQRTGRRSRGPMIALAVAGAVGVIGYLVVSSSPDRRAPAPLASLVPTAAVASGATLEVPEANDAPAREVPLDDGSSMTLHRGSRLQILANESDRFVTLLERGGARFDVRPGGPRRWQVETALATIEVAGTSFSVDQGSDWLVVKVGHGVVIVRGERVPGRVVRLTDGEELTVGTAPPVTAAVAAAPPQATGAAPPESAPVLASPPEADGATEPSVSDPPARGVASHAGGTRRAEDDGDRLVIEALANAERLRAEGDLAAAADALERALHAGGSGPATGVAAFSLGRLALDHLGQPARAERAFALVIRLGSPRDLLEDAYARRVEALLRAGDRGEAEAAIAAYERAYPQGRRRAALRAMLQAP